MSKQENSNKWPPSEEAPTQIPTPETWALYHETYQHVKETHNKRKDPHDERLYHAMASSNPSGFHVSYQAQMTPTKGRGLFAAQDIEKGTRICDDRSGFFETEREWRDFLASLPPALAKDCVDWASVMDDDEDGEEIVVMDFCDSALLNHGPSKPSFSRRIIQSLKECCTANAHKSHSTTEMANIVGKYGKDDGMFYFEATRNLQAGEELLCDYGKSAKYHHKLPWFNDIYREYYPDRIPSDKSELKRWD